MHHHSHRRAVFFSWALLIGYLAVQSPRSFGASPSERWHDDLSQQGRNERIVTEANSQVGDYGGQCKVFVQEVVWRASRGVVWLPQNDPDIAWRWKSSSDVRRIATDACIRLKPGYILQAQVRLSSGGLSPHTMIITEATNSRVTVVESNYTIPNRVTRRTVSINTFWNSLVHVTVYEIR